MIDVSIIIVHYNTPGLLRQTLRGIGSAAPQLRYEVIVVDNNPQMRVGEMVLREFPDVILIESSKNVGFGRGMNLGIEKARGRYVLVFNPDIILLPGNLEQLVEYMDRNQRVGICGPRLSNPDGSLQHSCYRFMDPKIILYRRVPVLRRFSFAQEAVDHYIMIHEDHDKTSDVDYLLGAAMFARRSAIDEVGGFDPEFFVYFEDQDWCRRFWKAGWKVVYHPEVELIHYHRRETAEGGFIKQLVNPLTRIQIQSALYYYKKYKGQPNPREHVARHQLSSQDRT